MEDNWEVVSIYPEEMLEPRKIVAKPFSLGTIAGSVGKKVDKSAKPGINEDGIIVARSDDLLLILIIDAHYERDITKIMIDHFKYEIKCGDWNLGPYRFSLTFLERCLDYCHDMVASLLRKDAKGEASFIITAIDLNRMLQYTFSVGDLMVFVHDPSRHWGKNFQLGSRQFYQWINKYKIMGYQLNKIRISEGTKVIHATDGLIDEPTIPMKEIDILFGVKPFDAETYVKHALESEADDNIAVVCLNF